MLNSPLSGCERRFAELQRFTHEQELDIVGPPQTLLFITAAVVLGVVGLVVYWLRDGNASAATTLDNIAALAPEQIIRSAVMTRLVLPPVTSVRAVETSTVASTLSMNIPQLAPGGPRERGVVHTFNKGRAFGRIREPDGADIFFHADEVGRVDRGRIRPGVCVSFRRGHDRQGRPAALEVRVVADG